MIKEAGESSHLPTGEEVVAIWEEEAKFFDFERPRWNPSNLPGMQINCPLFAECQRFSQMVWRDTTELGAARYWNTANNCVAIVCLYRPNGNSNAPGKNCLLL